MKKINTMKIEGKRWFQRSYGNTYHTVKIYVDGEILKSEITYGYGSHYLQTAAELLKENGYEIPEDNGKPDTSGSCVDFYFSILILVDAISDPRTSRFPKE